MLQPGLKPYTLAFLRGLKSSRGSFGPFCPAILLFRKPAQPFSGIQLVSEKNAG